MRPLMLFLGGSLLCSPGLCADQPGIGQLAAAAPQVEVPERPFFDRLIGTWDVVYEIYDKDGKQRSYGGQVTYRWILDGGALQEVWTSDAHDKVAQPYGTSIGFHDSKRQGWTQVWVYPAQGMVLTVSGGKVAGGLLLTGRDADGATQRWTLNDIQADSFQARYEISNDDGKTWRVLGVNHMQRHRT
jgi:hypothetical protein